MKKEIASGALWVQFCLCVFTLCGEPEGNCYHALEFVVEKSTIKPLDSVDLIETTIESDETDEPDEMTAFLFMPKEPEEGQSELKEFSFVVEIPPDGLMGGDSGSSAQGIVAEATHFSSGADFSFRSVTWPASLPSNWVLDDSYGANHQAKITVTLNSEASIGFELDGAGSIKTLDWSSHQRKQAEEDDDGGDVWEIFDNPDGIGQVQAADNPKRVMFSLLKVQIDESEFDRSWIGEEKMPYGMYLNEERELNVNLGPSPLPDGLSITFFPSVVDQRGGVSVVGNDTLSQSGKIKIKAEKLSERYQGGNIRIHARVGGISGPTIYSSPGFAVTALPKDWSESHFSSDFTNRLAVTWRSDSGHLDDLSDTLFREIIEVTDRPNPPFESEDVTVGPSGGDSMVLGSFPDEFFYSPYGINPTEEGETTLSQRYEVMDLRSSSTPKWVLLYETTLKYELLDNGGVWELSFERVSEYHSISEGPWTHSSW